MATPLRLHPAASFASFSHASVHVGGRLAPLRLRIGSFELDPKSGELSNAGNKVVLQSQPLQLLLMLIEGGGEMVTRAEIEHQLWGEDVIVEFDHSINQLVRKLRRALGDSAKNPSYIETVASRGYRLKVPVEAFEKAIASFQGANDMRSAAGKLPNAWNSHEARKPAASGSNSAMRLQEMAGAAEPCEHRRSHLGCRPRAFRQSEQQPQRATPMLRVLAAQPVRQYLLSAIAPERLEALRQLLVLVTQALDSEPV